MSYLPISQVLVLNQSPISAIPLIVRNLISQKIVLTGDPLYLQLHQMSWTEFAKEFVYFFLFTFGTFVNIVNTEYTPHHAKTDLDI